MNRHIAVHALPFRSDRDDESYMRHTLVDPAVEGKGLGSLLARRCQGDAWEDAVRYANAAAALSTLGYGAVDPLPRAEQVWERLKETSG